MLPLIGTSDHVDLLGYVIERCPACGTVGPLGVYEAKKKITLYFIPTVPYSKHQLVECKVCHARFVVPEEMRESLRGRLITQDELSEQIGRMQAGRANGHGIGGSGAVAGGRPRGRTYYQVLQVDLDAEPEVIEAAFKRLALKYHPDRSPEPDAPERMRQLIEARDVLSDAQKKRAYDASLGIVRKPPPPSAPPQPKRAPGLRPDEV
jgi:hypothetical protein